MDTSKIFNEFINNLDIQNEEEILGRYKSIAKALNRWFFEIDSGSENSVQIGSFGRKTAVNGISDLDVLFVLHDSEYKRYDSYGDNGQSALLQDVRKAIKETYSKTDVRGDGQVVVVSFTNYFIEVCPVFPQADGSYKYPDANNGGAWKKTNPIPEIFELNLFNGITNGNVKNLARIARAWKNKCGVKIGGLLIDTLCYEFLKDNSTHYATALNDYDVLVRDFFDYLKETDKSREYWHAPGSNQKVYKKSSNFIKKAKKAYVNIIEAIEKKDNDSVYAIWKKVFGYPFPYPQTIRESSVNYTSDEEFIENQYSVDIRNTLIINCEVTQPGYRTELLRNIFTKLKANKKLKFYIEYTDVIKPYEVKWKVKNEGKVARDRNNLRGHILNDQGNEIRNENTNFSGPHFVECYIIKDNICVARDRIDVPIENT